MPSVGGCGHRSASAMRVGNVGSRACIFQSRRGDDRDELATRLGRTPHRRRRRGARHARRPGRSGGIRNVDAPAQWPAVRSARFSRDDAEAEDALQDAYLDAYRHIGSFRGGATLATWLTRIVINQALMRLRRRRRDRIVIPFGGRWRTWKCQDDPVVARPVAFPVRRLRGGGGTPLESRCWHRRPGGSSATHTVIIEGVSFRA